MKKEDLEALRKAAEEIEKALRSKQKVCSKSCDQCLFSKNKIVSEKRKQEILGECEREQTHFICHKGSIIGENIVCNGFYRNKTTPYLELMKDTRRIEFVDTSKLLIEEKKRQEDNVQKKIKAPKRVKKLR